MHTPSRPRLVFFQHQSQSNPGYIQLHAAQHVRCLSEFFDLTLVSEDCDYDRICDLHQPHLALFESSVYPGRTKISNVFSHPEVPKLGLIHADAYCNSREPILSAMAHWGIETFFSIAVSMGEYTPDIAAHLFTWPNSVDPALYKDYGEPKTVPVLVTGSHASHYPWRNRINSLLASHYPTLTCPHFGWSGQQTGRMIYGEQYARLLNASTFVPTCGTISKEVIRKHFEIPAARACLVTEQTDALAAAGFVDMVNCVFATSHDVVDKVEYLLANPDVLHQITDAGYHLVHSRHTLQHRDQILQWFRLSQHVDARTQDIIQPGPFAPLTLVDRSLGLSTVHSIGPGVDRMIMAEGDRCLWSGRYTEAQTLYRRCQNYHDSMPEPKLRLALCSLHQGNATVARDWLAEPLRDSLEIYQAVDPDPCEWAYFIITLICLGELAEALYCAAQFPTLSHPELERARWLTGVVTGTAVPPLSSDAVTRRRHSVHQLPPWNHDEWVSHVKHMLTACSQGQLAARIDPAGSVRLPVSAAGARPTPDDRRPGPSASLSVASARLRDGKWLHETLAERIRGRVNRSIVAIVNSPAVAFLEAASGYALPYRLTRKRPDAFFDGIYKLCRQAEIKSVLIVGAAPWQGPTERAIAALLKNPTMPTVDCVTTDAAGLAALRNTHRANPSVRCHQVAALAAGGPDLASCIHSIQQDRQDAGFDLLLIDGSELIWAVPDDLLDRAQTVILDDINTVENHHNYRRLRQHPKYALVMHEPALRNGCAMFSCGLRGGGQEPRALDDTPGSSSQRRLEIALAGCSLE